MFPHIVSAQTTLLPTFYSDIRHRLHLVSAQTTIPIGAGHTQKIGLDHTDFHETNLIIIYIYTIKWYNALEFGLMHVLS